MSQICDLPDDILVSVLSFLPLKEAGMTSILSKRWRHAWRHAVEYIPTHNFDSSNIVLYIEKNTEVPQDPPYVHWVHWVDQVVNLHKAPTLNELTVRFDIPDGLDGKTKNNIDSWIRFSMEKRVNRLTIDLSPRHGQQRKDGMCYTAYTYPSLPVFSTNLTSLVLSSVNIAGEVIESFLYNCPALEYLSASHSDTLKSLKVAGPSLSLKYLNLHRNSSLKQLEISAPNLISCSHEGQDMSVQYSMPKVVEISCGLLYPNTDVKSCFENLGCHLSQIEVLKLFTNVIFKYITMPIEYPVLKKLKKLDLKLVPDIKDDLFHFMPLIQACPLLYHLKIQLIWLGPRREAMRTCSHPYNMNMKIVEIVGFLGLVVDVEFVLYLAESVVSLDTIILDTCPVDNLAGPSMEHNKTRWRKKSMERSERVRAHLKPGTKLVIC